MSPRPSADRLAHIDTLRALAALMVACAHIWERYLPFASAGSNPRGAQSWPRYFDFGITGVVLFFSISGFVIYGTLRGPRRDAGRRFIISRFFRLYPAYWVSMVGGLIFIWWWQRQTITLAMIAANATMLPTIFRQPQIMGLYWTLETELAFYVSCWIVWRIGQLENPRFLAGLIVGVSLSWFLVKGAKQLGVVPDDVLASWKNLPRHLGIMFWGAYFRIVYDETHGFRDSLGKNRKLWTLIALTIFIVALGGARQFRFFVHPSRNWISPYAIGPLFFWVWVAWLRVRYRMLAWLGTISYSIYLFHLVIATPLIYWVALPGNVALRGWPTVCYLIPLLILTVAVSAGVYYAVEWPAILLGKRLAGTATKSGSQAAP